MKFCPNEECARYSGNNIISTFEDTTKNCPECGSPLADKPAGDWVAISNALLSIEAQILCNRLLAKGIQAYITDEHVSSFYILTTFGGAQVMVRQEDHTKAWDILGNS